MAGKNIIVGYFSTVYSQGKSLSSPLILKRKNNLSEKKLQERYISIKTIILLQDKFKYNVRTILSVNYANITENNNCKAKRS